MRTRWAAATVAGMLVVAGCTNGSGDELVSAAPASVSGLTSTTIPAVALCPPGSTPDRPGPADQADSPGKLVTGSAMDAQSGRVVAVGMAGCTYTRDTWAYDLPTNTWTELVHSTK